eukprot:sb/3474341/
MIGGGGGADNVYTVFIQCLHSVYIVFTQQYTLVSVHIVSGSDANELHRIVGSTHVSLSVHIVSSSTANKVRRIVGSERLSSTVYRFTSLPPSLPLSLSLSLSLFLNLSGKMSPLIAYSLRIHSGTTLHSLCIHYVFTV